ncbi:hypothetical protein BLOT_004098 [Blomia tropicalis]|nr:hypothetical protein BLOT_004098 [Blomia tropicalis]
MTNTTSNSNENSNSSSRAIIGRTYKVEKCPREEEKDRSCPSTNMSHKTHGPWPVAISGKLHRSIDRPNERTNERTSE